MHFHLERSMLGLPLLSLRYSLRARHYRRGDRHFVLHFDDVHGDLCHVSTVVEFEAISLNESVFRYKTVISDPSRLRSALLRSSGKADLKAHMGAFHDYAIAAWMRPAARRGAAEATKAAV